MGLESSRGREPTSENPDVGHPHFRLPDFDRLGWSHLPEFDR